MDNLKAQELASRLINKSFEGYTILELINNGKSAAVFKATDNNGNLVAVKIFDDELIKRFGHEIQLMRIEQELKLKNHDIRNLIKIIDGGRTLINSKSHYFLVMEHVQGKNLKDFIDSQEYSLDFIRYTIESLIIVTEQLLVMNIVHRDIKPENIMVNALGNIILMDLGVLKIIGAESSSDNEEKQFLGTLRYAPPEFLTRQEEDSSNGWRSVNLYQIGAVLYELIEKKDLFHSEIPYPNLVLAIKEKNPIINSRETPSNLIQLARNLLTKNWQQRLDINPINRILELCSNSEKEVIKSDLIENELEEINIKSIEHENELDHVLLIRSNFEQKLQKKNGILQEIFAVLNANLVSLKTKGLIASWKSSQPFMIYINDNELVQPQYLIYELKGLLTKGFSRPVYLVYKIVNDENAYCEVGLAVVLMDKDVEVDVHKKSLFFYELGIQLGHDNLSGKEDIGFFNIFKGVINTKDLDTRSNLLLITIKFIKKAISLMSSEVKKEISTQREMSERGLKKIAIIRRMGEKNTHLINTLE
jgi:serine/threonine protein kinase